jgi:hypothetical protein
MTHTAGSLPLKDFPFLQRRHLRPRCLFLFFPAEFLCSCVSSIREWWKKVRGKFFRQKSYRLTKINNKRVIFSFLQISKTWTLDIIWLPVVAPGFWASSHLHGAPIKSLFSFVHVHKKKLKNHWNIFHKILCLGQIFATFYEIKILKFIFTNQPRDVSNHQDHHTPYVLLQFRCY